jgi:transcriptional regulator with XRE-family HTH domain
VVRKLKERLTKVRKAKGLSQQEFADKLNIKRGTIANYECGRNEPIDAVINLICREFNVNEAWLRTGEGEMFLPMDRETELAKLTIDLFMEESDSFKSRFISMLARMSDEEWTMLENMVEKLSKKE